ncbi:kinesin-like protein KIN-14C isoform X3 [Rhodamnia argentea]|uniref:Kinesin-like protein KIN-14C isoform X3 n=1 Tax=Rhodamnia argentea TaxID=178133 RepID=A0ABM3HKY3_9MYRT|nr:kinesin-like protein KIN-14C isoform X3 [Rhodamnia argentea]
MEPLAAKSMKENGLSDRSYQIVNNDNVPTENNDAKQRVLLIEWLTSICPDLALPLQASEEELRSSLIDGSVLFLILKRLRPSYINEGGYFDQSSAPHKDRIKRFLAAMDEMGIPRFEIADLEKGSMKPVIECLLSIQAQLMPNERRKALTESKFQRALRSPVMPEPSATLMHHGGLKFHEVFQLKQGRYADLPAAKISEMMKSNSLDNAPTQSLLSVVNGILDESIERKNNEIPHRVACLLRKVVQEIERRISTQAEHLRTQNNLFKAREEKYQSRLKVLEALATGPCEETERLQTKKIKTELKIEEKRKLEDEDLARLTKEKESHNLEILALKQELELAKKTYELRHLQMETEAKADKMALEERTRKLEQDLAGYSNKVEELEVAKKMHQLGHLQIETEANAAKMALEERTRKLEQDLAGYRNKVEELEAAKKTYQLSHLQNETEANAAKMALEERTRKLEQDLAGYRNKVEELEAAKKTYQLRHLQIETEANAAKMKLEERIRKLEQDLAGYSTKVQELEEAKKTYQLRHLQIETEANAAKMKFEDRIRKLEQDLADSINKVKQLEAYSESRNQKWNKKEHRFHDFMDFQFGALRELRVSFNSIKHELLVTQRSYTEEFNSVGLEVEALGDAAENYHQVLAENRRLFNEVQDLKGNIRVFCRIRPLISGQSGKQSIVERTGDDGQLVVANPSKQGKDGQRMFKFNKVYGPAASQEMVYSDVQPFIRSVLDGYNVCIFAYGQTGSGKTYTMSGPNGATKESWGVNNRALNDLFNISESRRKAIVYEILVQMVEIYNEQVRDLLSSGGSQKKLGISSVSQVSGIAVPDASMHPVRASSDVIELMDIGLKNRAVGATALNERSSRSHSIVTVHVRGTDVKTGSTSHGNLHLVDLAGSERVDRSEVTGDRLKEAQHINKSLSALGDVIFALSQKSPHVPYRNSKLTQVLQTSLGGQAKTLMFVQLNPDVLSYSESMSTLKFAERVSGVELGAARSSKDGKDVRELMQQVASLRDTIAKKDEEIERLQLLKDLKNVYPAVEKRSVASPYDPSSPSQIPSKGVGLNDPENASAHGDRHYESDLHVPGDDRYGDQEYEERTSDVSDCSAENSMSSDAADRPDSLEKPKPGLKVPPPLRKSASRESLKASTSARKTVTTPTGSSTLLKPPRRWQ